VCCIVAGSRATCPQSAELQYMYEWQDDDDDDDDEEGCELLVSVVLYQLQVS